MCRELDYRRMTRERRAFRRAAAEFVHIDLSDSDESYDSDQPDDPRVALPDIPPLTRTDNRPVHYGQGGARGGYDVEALRAALFARSLPAYVNTPLSSWDPEWEDRKNSLNSIFMSAEEVASCPPPQDNFFWNEPGPEPQPQPEPMVEQRQRCNDAGHMLIPRAEVCLLFRSMARILRQNSMNTTGIRFMSSVNGGVPFRPPSSTAYFIIRPTGDGDWLDVLKELRRKCVIPWLGRLPSMLEEQVSFDLRLTDSAYQQISIDNGERDSPDPELYIQNESEEEEEEEEGDDEDDEYDYDDGELDDDDLRPVTFEDYINSVRFGSREQAVVDVARDLKPDAWLHAVVFGAKTAFTHKNVTVVLAVEAPRRGIVYEPPMIPQNLLRPSRLDPFWR